MTLFKKAENTQAYLKMGILGFAGSGKTYTATQTAIGLCQHIKKQDEKAAKPILFLDTETGSDWVQPAIKKAGLELHTAKTKAFVDLLKAVEEAQGSASVLIIDSITHFWTELTESYAKKKNRTRGLEFQDWAFLKREWRRFTDSFINSSLHIILCGRAGFEYDYFTDDTGKKQLEKTNIKMKAESEMGYEPSLLVLMEREMNMENNKVFRMAKILKDRSTFLDGKEFKNPTFKDFAPHINFLNLGGLHIGIDATRNSEELIGPDGKSDWQREKIETEITLDEIESLLVKHYPGQSADDKKKKKELLEKHFGSLSWERIKTFDLLLLKNGYTALKADLEKAPADSIPEKKEEKVGDKKEPEKEVIKVTPDFLTKEIDNEIDLVRLDKMRKKYAPFLAQMPLDDGIEIEAKFEAKKKELEAAA